MRWLIGILGVVFASIGLGILALIGLGMMAGRSAMQSVGSLWFAVDAASLNALQVVIERHLWPPLWQHIVFPFLRLDALAALGVTLGLGLLLIGIAVRLGRR